MFLMASNPCNSSSSLVRVLLEIAADGRAVGGLLQPGEGGWDAPRTGEEDAWREDVEMRRPPACGVEATAEAIMEEDPSIESRRPMWV